MILEKTRSKFTVALSLLWHNNLMTFLHEFARYVRTNYFLPCAHYSRYVIRCLNTNYFRRQMEGITTQVFFLKLWLILYIWGSWAENYLQEPTGKSRQLHFVRRKFQVCIPFQREFRHQQISTMDVLMVDLKSLIMTRNSYGPKHVP